MITSGIYSIRNTITGDQYIGSAVKLEHRFAGHRRDLTRGSHGNIHLQRAWNKYGGAVFLMKPILFCHRSHLLMYEQRLLDGLKPTYNIARSVTAPMLGRITPQDVRVKLSSALKGREFSEKHKSNLRAAWKPRSPEAQARFIEASRGNKFCLGRKLSVETKKKISESQLGKIISASARGKMAEAKRGGTLTSEHKAKIAAALVGKPRSMEVRARISVAQKGRRFTEEHKQKMRLARSRYTMSKEHCANISLALKGRRISDEQKAQISAAHKGKIVSVETRKKLSAIMKKRAPRRDVDGKFLSAT